MSFRSIVATLFGLLMLGALSPGSTRAQTPPGALTRAPRLAHFVEAPYPESMRGDGHAARVLLAIDIAADGHVENATVVESGGEAFDAAALEAVRQFVFEPAQIDGVDARIRVRYAYDFVAYVAPVVVEPTTRHTSLVGTVRDLDGGGPVAGATITLEDGTTATTDETGHFRFDDLAPGPHEVSISGERIPTVQAAETLVENETLEVDYAVGLVAVDVDDEPGTIRIIVFAPRITESRHAVEVDTTTARQMAGTGGEPVAALGNMPGTVRSSGGSGTFVVWGAAPEDTGVYVDGVRVPRLYHDGGARAVMGAETVRAVQLVPGGYGSPYGRGLGGLVLVSTHRADADERLNATGAMDVYDASASFRGRLTDRVSLSVAGRRSYVASLLRHIASSDIEDFYPLPHYYDAQARLGVRLRDDREWLDVTTMVSGDHTRRSVVNADPARSTTEERGLSFQRVYARYGRELDDGAEISVVAYAGRDQRSLTSAYGPLLTYLRADTTMVGLRASYRTRVTPWLTVEGGLDSEIANTSVTRQGSLAAPPREGDIRVFGQPPPDQLGNDAYSVTYVNAAPYAQAQAALADDRLNVTLGLRVDPYARSVSRVNPGNATVPALGAFAQNLRVEPRAEVRYAPTQRGHVQASFGLYGQSPQAADLSSVFGNPNLDAAKGQHYVLGGGFTILEARTADEASHRRARGEVTVEVTTFLTRTSGLAMRNQAASPALAQALLSDGAGRAYGAQVLLRMGETRGVSGWISYTLMKAERQDAAGLPYRPFDFDQRHVFTALAGYDLGHGFQIGARARVATGVPRTAVTGAYYDSRRDLYQPTFGEHNGIRIPTFFQLDVRVSKTFRIHDTSLELSLDVQNVTNRENVEELVYNADYTVRGAIHGLPIIPVLGLRWSLR